MKAQDLQFLFSANYSILEITLKGNTPDLPFLNQFILSALPAYSRYYITSKFCISKIKYYKICETNALSSKTKHIYKYIDLNI